MNEDKDKSLYARTKYITYRGFNEVSVAECVSKLDLKLNPSLLAEESLITNKIQSYQKVFDLAITNGDQNCPLNVTCEIFLDSIMQAYLKELCYVFVNCLVFVSLVFAFLKIKQNEDYQIQLLSISPLTMDMVTFSHLYMMMIHFLVLSDLINKYVAFLVLFLYIFLVMHIDFTLIQLKFQLEQQINNNQRHFFKCGNGLSRWMKNSLLFYVILQLTNTFDQPMLLLSLLLLPQILYNFHQSTTYKFDHIFVFFYCLPQYFFYGVIYCKNNLLQQSP